MAIEKLNDEELDMVTGGNRSENRDLGIHIHCGTWDISKMANWLKTNLNIDCSLSNGIRTDNKYSITENGVKRTLSQEDVLGMIDEYHIQHPDS